MSFGIEWLICFGYDRMERITRDYSCSMAANVEVMSFRLFSLRCHSSTQPHTKKHSFNFSRSLQNYIVIECIESNRLDRLSAILCSRNCVWVLSTWFSPEFHSFYGYTIHSSIFFMPYSNDARAKNTNFYGFHNMHRATKNVCSLHFSALYIINTLYSNSHIAFKRRQMSYSFYCVAKRAVALSERFTIDSQFRWMVYNRFSIPMDVLQCYLTLARGDGWQIGCFLCAFQNSGMMSIGIVGIEC